MRHVESMSIDVRVRETERTRGGNTVTIPREEWEYTHYLRIGLEGQRSLYLFCIGKTLPELLDGSRDIVSDLAHVCKVDMGSLWTFYDVNIGSAWHGEFKSKYTRLEIVTEIREYLLTAISDAEKTICEAPLDEYGHPRQVRLDFADELVQWRTWHQGAGQADFECRNAETADALTRWRKHPKFEEMAQRLLTIARNGTRKPEDRKLVPITYRGPREFNFVAGGMYGGLFNHGTDEAPDWSIHT